MGRLLDLKRCEVNSGPNGNPENGILQTVGIPKAVLNISVPNIVGMTRVNAIAACTAVNLGCFQLGGAGATVNSQSPAAGAQVAKGFAVNAIYL